MERRRAGSSLDGQLSGDMMDDNFVDRIGGVYGEMLALLEAKNSSYGSSALKGEGIMPLIGNQVRLCDKTRRYEHMMLETIKNGGKIPEYFGESIEDTLKDILGYATLGLLIVEDLKEKGEIT